MIIEVASWIAVGLLTGSLARIVMPGPPAGGIRVALLIGVLGALTAGFAGAALLASDSFGLSLGLAINGALYSLFVYRCVAMRFRTELVDLPANSNRERAPNTPIYTGSFDFGKLVTIGDVTSRR